MDRRDLFRTSVITALGVAAGAVAGYEIAEVTEAKPLAPGDADSVLALQDTSISKTWYLFYFVTSTQCQLYSLYYVPTITTTTNINTSTWFQVADKHLISSGTKKIQYLDKDGNPAELTITFAGGYLDPDSLKRLAKVFPPAAPQVPPGSWNEIGKQHS